MKKVTLSNYKSDTYYPKIVKAFDELLTKQEVICPIDLFIQLGNLTPSNHKNWITGKVPYLERVIAGNLSKFSRILKIIGFHAHDLNMKPCKPNYSPNVRGTKKKLRYSKIGTQSIEDSYTKAYKWNRKLTYEEWKSEQED